MSWPKNQPKFSKHESAAAWGRIEEPFIQMYLVEKLKLEEVRLKLARDYHFSASYDWFWTQIRRRNLQRKPRIQPNPPPDAHVILGEDVQPRSSWQDESTHPVTNASSRDGQIGRPKRSKFEGRRTQRTRNKPLQSQDISSSLTYDVETSLRCCESCLLRIGRHWEGNQPSQPLPLHLVSAVHYGTRLDYAFIDSFLNGIRLAEKSNKQAGWRHFASGCSLVQQYIQDRPWTVLIQFLEFYVEERWDQAHDIRNILTSVFAAEAEKAEKSCPGSSHLLSTLFRFWIKDNVVKDALLQILQLMSKHCVASTTGDRRGRAFIQAELAWKYTDVGSYVEAGATSTTLLQTKGIPIDITVSAIRNLASIRRSRGDLLGAISLVREATTLCEKHSSDFLVPEESIRLIKDLGRLKWDCGWQTEGVQCFWKALDLAAQLFNSEDSEAQVFYLELQTVLERCRDVDGLSSLAAKHPWVKEMIACNSLLERSARQ